ncbi:MAG: cytidylate kinase-like family protein [Angelakisella sp.]
MTNNLVITISRQYGSNGRHIGMALAKELGVAFYDKELIKLAATQNGISEKMFEEADEMPSNSFLYSLSMGSRNFGTGFNYMDCLSNDKLFLMQSKVIRELADKGPCVIVGRCADYILRDHENCINIFLHASPEFRIAHVMEELDISEEAAKDMIRRVGKKRASYYNYYSDVEWGHAASYHLSLDVTHLNEKSAVSLLKDYLTVRELI